MEPLFPPWANDAMRAALALALGSAVAVPTALIFWARTPYATGQLDAPDQPVQFDHRHHVRDDGIACLYCHQGADHAPFAGVPPTALCMGCHSQIWNSSPLLEPVRRAYFTGRPLRWERVTTLPDFVFFNHQAHVAHGVGCESCHGRVDQMAQVARATPLTMGWCLDCHRHPIDQLRPLEHVTDMGFEPAPGTTRRALGEQVARELHVAPPTNCTACHR